MTEVKQKGSIKLYACGGAGINIGKTFEEMRGQSSDMFATLDVAYLDTSAANLSDPKIPLSAVYKVPGKDGSGQLRKLNAEDIFARAPEMLEKHQPLDLNIVLHSFSGGSGSVIGPALVSELISRDCLTIAIGIGEADTVTHMENTQKTILSYIGVSAARERSVVASYFENSNLTPMEDVNLAIAQLITALSVLASRENIGLDSRDLNHLINFDRVIQSYGPQLALLSVFEGTSISDNIGNIITVATLATQGGTASIGQMINYQTVGRLPSAPDGKESPVHAQAPVHFVVSDGLWAETEARLDAALTEFRRKEAARVPKDQQSLVKKVAGGPAKNGVCV